MKESAFIKECFYRISVKALIKNEAGKVLLIQEDNGLWDLPGGGLNHGESVKEGLVREVREEMGLQLSLKNEVPRYFFTCSNPKGEPIANIIYDAYLESFDFVASGECMALGFFDFDEVNNIKTYENVSILMNLIYPVGGG